MGIQRPGDADAELQDACTSRGEQSLDCQDDDAMGELMKCGDESYDRSRSEERRVGKECA